MAYSVQAQVAQLILRGELPGWLAPKLRLPSIAPSALHVEVDSQGIFHVEVQFDDRVSAAPLLVVVVGHGVRREAQGSQ